MDYADVKEELALKEKKIEDMKEIHLKEIDIYKERIDRVKIEMENVQMREEEHQSHIQRQKEKLLKFEKRHKEDRDEVEQV